MFQSRVLRKALPLSLAILVGCQFVNALTITDNNGIIYDIVNGTQNVNISSSNAGLAFLQQTDVERLVITEKVRDVSASASSTDNEYTVVGMSPGAFRNCSGLKSIEIQAPIPAIPSQAFDGCSGLTSVVLPNSVTTIDYRAFYGCSAMSSIAGFSSLTTIGTEAFRECSALKRIVLPENLTSVGAYAFYKCASLESLAFPDKVTSLPNYVCSYCSSLESVGLPETVTTIGEESFSHCDILQMPSLPSSLSLLGKNAFAYCGKLGSVTLPAELSMREGCFMNSYVTDIVFPSEKLSLGSKSFQNNSGLRKVTLPAWIHKPELVTQGWVSNVFENSQDLEEVAMEDGITEIGDHWFADCKKLSKVTCAPSLKEIQSRAFSACASLVDLTLPTEMEAIQTSAFNGCTSLTTVNVPKSTSIGDNAFASTGLVTINLPDAPLGTVSSSAFYHIPTVKSLVIPGKIGTLPGSLFAYYEGLESVVIEEGVTEIPNSMFECCRNLSSVTLPSTLETIGESAFGATYNIPSSLTSLTFPEGLREIKAGAFYYSALTEAVFPSTLEIIGYSDQTGPGTQTVFGNSGSLKKITFKGCKIIGNSAFLQCGALEEIIFPSNLEKISSYAFSNCNKLASIEIPDGVKTVGDYAFQYCKGLQSATLSGGTDYGNKVFLQCNALTAINFPETESRFGTNMFESCCPNSIVLPDWMVTVPEGMFINCSMLDEVTFGKNISVISKNAFNGCHLSKLTSLPSSLTEIGEKAFQKGIMTEMTLPPYIKIGNEAFANTYIQKINLPTVDDPEKFDEEVIDFGNSVFAYTNVQTIQFPAWMTVIPNGFLKGSNVNTIGFLGEVTEIDDDAFRGCSKLHDVVFPATIDRIGKYAFSQCGSTSIPFGKVTIPADVLIDEHAFDGSMITELEFEECADLRNGCLANLTAITSLKFPTCMTDIKAEFCSGWKNLEKVELSPATTHIGDKAFYFCSKLTTIDIPETVVSIGTEAFNFSGLKEIILPDHDVLLANGALRSQDYVTWSATFPSPLETVKLSRKQTVIPDECFSGNSRMKSIQWYDDEEDAPSASLAIGTKAFYKCVSMDKIEFPNKNLTIGDLAFYGCTGASDIIWPENDKEVTIGGASFENCQSLESVVVPDLVKEISGGAFRGCSNLATITLGKEVTKIGKEAFKDSGVENIVWNNKVTTIEEDGFKNAKLVAVELPDCVATLGSNTFAANTRDIEVEVDGATTTKTIGTIERFSLNSTLTEIPYSCFSNSISAEEIRIPSNIKVINPNAFQYCGEKILTFENADGQGIERIESSAFHANTNLEFLEIPSTLIDTQLLGHIGDYAFENCTSLRKIVNTINKLKLKTAIFRGCTSLEEFSSPVNIERFGNFSFANCSSLSKIDIPNEIVYDEKGAKRGAVSYGESCFENCTSLADLSFLSSAGSLDKYTFKNCPSITQFTFSKLLDDQMMSDGLLQGDSNLQSITWENTGATFKLKPSSISGAPLEALSYSYNPELRMPLITDKDHFQYFTYQPDAAYPTTNSERSILMVPRGERWKYIKMGYDQVFDIREMRAPQIDLQGDIRSSFSSRLDEDGNIIQLNDNMNHYHANLRWHMPLSDFNTNGETVVRIYRDDICIGRVHFSVPQALTKTEMGDAWKYPEVDKIWRVTMTYDNPDDYSEYTDHCKFTGDFTTSTEIENEYKMEYVYQEDYMDFDYYTHQRLLDYVNNGYKSWFAFCDIFTSLPLNDPKVAATYTYSAVMEGFPYETLENNADFELVDGKRYSVVTKNAEQLPFQSNDVVLYSSIATPKVFFDGLVTLSDIQQDKVKGMKHIDMSNNDINNLRVGYSIDEKTIKHRYEYAEKHENDFVIKKFLLYELNSDGTLKKVGENNLSSRQSEGHFDVEWGYSFSPKTTYVLVTETNSRGNFGSASITIPDVPTLSPEVTEPMRTNHFDDPDSDWHTNVAYKVSIKSGLNCSAMGYNDKQPLSASDYYIGLMRRHSSPMLRAQGSDSWSMEDDNTDLIHHWDGRQTEVDADVCSDCQAEVGSYLVHDAEAGPIYNDHVEVPYNTSADLDYLMRAYVKVPDNMLRTAEPTFMLAQANVSTKAPIVSGIENVTLDDDADFNLADFDEADIRYFDLQGRQIVRPAAGTPCIAVTPAGSRKIVVR